MNFEIVDVDAGKRGVLSAVVSPDVGGDCDGHVGVEARWGQDDAVAAVVGDCGSEIGIVHTGADGDAGVVERRKVG